MACTIKEDWTEFFHTYKQNKIETETLEKSRDRVFYFTTLLCFNLSRLCTWTCFLKKIPLQIFQYTWIEIHWTPEGKRKRGRLNTSWRRTVEVWSTEHKLAKNCGSVVDWTQPGEELWKQKWRTWTKAGAPSRGWPVTDRDEGASLLPYICQQSWPVVMTMNVNRGKAKRGRVEARRRRLLVFVIFCATERGATARYYTSHTKTMLPTRKSSPRSCRQLDHMETSWPS